VVIAIIAILAAILFPVFAQAKEAAKKTQQLSNAKQMGLGMRMYSGDYDDIYVLSIWTPIPGPTGTEAEHWAQRIFPYIKNSEVFFDPNGPKVTERDMRITKAFAAGPNASVPLWFRNNISEGSLERASEFIVYAPTGVTDFFNDGSVVRAGSEFNPWHANDGWSLPHSATMRCQQRFHPDKDAYIAPSQRGFAFAWRYADGTNFARADGSAKFAKRGTIKPEQMYPGAIPAYASEPTTVCRWPAP